MAMNNAEQDAPVDYLTGERVEPFWENFRNHPVAQTTHFCTAFLSLSTALAGGYFIDPVFVGGLGLVAVVCVRQVSEFQKRRDAIGHDMAWIVAGAATGALGSLGAAIIARMP